MMESLCKGKTVPDCIAEINAIERMGHKIWSYAYMRTLYARNSELYFAVALSDPVKIMPIVYTPTVGEACQKFGELPFHPRGCYVSITDRGNIVQVLKDYAAAHLKVDASGKYECDCIVFSDGGRILGLGDLGAWGMGIPIGKLDLYTVCAGVDPRKTCPVIIDAGIHDADGNTAKLDIRGNKCYTGLKQDRVCHKSQEGTLVNTCYYGEGNMIDEFMQAACEVFGDEVLLQFEDFNSNDAFPLLARQRTKFLSYNDDIQGTAAVCVAGLLGAIKLKNPTRTDLINLLSQETILLHGAGSANLGAASLLHNEGKVPKSHIFMTNSRGLIWKNDEGQGSYRNNDQKEFAVSPEPAFSHTTLLDVIKNCKPSALVGAVGVDPGCFTKEICEAMMKVNTDGQAECDDAHRPIIFALSNPKSQAEVTSKDCYEWTDGHAVYGAGTQMEAVTVKGKLHFPGQVNNVYIFPGLSYAAVQCKPTSITDRLFMVAAEAVANSISEQERQEDRVMPSVARIREVSLNVSVAVVWECQKLGLSRKTVGATLEEVRNVLAANMYVPTM